METDNGWEKIKKYVLIHSSYNFSDRFRYSVLRLHVFLILNFSSKNCIIIFDKQNYILLETNIDIIYVYLNHFS